uniref:Uncharacterized protein n=1 Tax=viral metagenome TaxID=1070528 RepID=A0A6M3L640_9ZZZZ
MSTTTYAVLVLIGILFFVAMDLGKRDKGNDVITLISDDDDQEEHS